LSLEISPVEAYARVDGKQDMNDLAAAAGDIQVIGAAHIRGKKQSTVPAAA
jgi:hypothetical protein